MPIADHHISKALVSELQTILREDYGVEMNHEEVSSAAMGYIGYFDTLAEMAKANNENEYGKTKKEK